MNAKSKINTSLLAAALTALVSSTASYRPPQDGGKRRSLSVLRVGYMYGTLISALLFVLVGSLPASTASLTFPRNVLGEWCLEGDDNCEPDGVPGPMLVLPTSIKNWGDYEHDGIDCAVRMIPIPNWDGEASFTFADGYTSISFDLDCRGRGKSFKGRALGRLQGDRLIIATRVQKGELVLEVFTRRRGSKRP